MTFVLFVARSLLPFGCGYAALGSYEAFEVGGVLDGVTLGVVVEIGEDIQPFGQVFPDFRSPDGEKLVGIAPAIAVSVKTEIEPPRCNLPGMVIDHVMNA